MGDMIDKDAVLTILNDRVQVGSMVEAIAALPAAPVEVKVKPLEWDRHGEGPVVWKAITALGTYFICDDTDDFTGLYLELVTHQNAQWWGKCDVLVVPIADHLNHPDEAELQAAAQADYESRTLATLQTKGDA